jgi:cytochrome P450
MTDAPLAPGAWPLLGHAPQLARAPREFFERLRACGPLVRIRIGSRPIFVVTRPDLARRVLLTEQDLFDKGGPFIEKGRLLIGNGLAACPAADHAHQRPLMQPAFHRNRMPNYTRIMRDAAAEVADSWHLGQVIRLDEQVHRMTAMVISRTLISAKVGAPAAAHIFRSVPDLVEGLYWRMVMPGRLFPKIPFPVNRRFDRAMTRTRDLLDPVVSQYRATRTDHADLLSMVVSAYEQEPDPQQTIYDQVINIMLGATETTASAVVWTLRLLDRHPDVAERLLAEVQDVLGGRLPDHDDLPKLAYTQRVLTETLRLYPPIWLLGRAATGDVTWKEGNIPAGSAVLASYYSLHRDPEVFADPETFDPDRWSPERITLTQRQGFFGLGAGRRKCIGDAFGMNEATIAVATILSRWQLHHQHSTSTERPVMRMVLLAPATTVTVTPR